jgi:hypothetical protein
LEVNEYVKWKQLYFKTLYIDTISSEMELDKQVFLMKMKMKWSLFESFYTICVQ